MMGGNDYAGWFQLAGKGAAIQTFWGYHNGPHLAPQLKRIGRQNVFVSSGIPCGGIDGGVEPMNASQAKREREGQGRGDRIGVPPPFCIVYTCSNVGHVLHRHRVGTARHQLCGSSAATPPLRDRSRDTEGLAVTATMPHDRRMPICIHLDRSGVQWRLPSKQGRQST